MADVLTSIAHGAGRITLNRPQALHALTTEMCVAMTEALLAWLGTGAAEVVLIEHDRDTRGFCAGGDIRMIAESGVQDGVAARRFFHAEYRLNHLLFEYPRPVVAFMDGITMGGGVGISMPADFRIATERTIFAMPETGIGLFPDIGGGWYLPRLPGEIGMWLALTGARLKAADCIAAGIATHHVPSHALMAARAQISAAAEAVKTETALKKMLGELNEAPGDLIALKPEHRERIDRLFAGESVEAVFDALAADGSDWAQEQLAILQTKSPQTLKVAFRQLREGKRMARFADEMRVEYRIAARVSARPDFAEGVRALLIDKDNAPRWSPPTLAGVTDAMLDEIFAPLPADEEWTPLPEFEEKGP